MTLGGRSIPTCVGFTPWWMISAATNSGPSPRAWGLPESERHLVHHGRSIPTCVGFTQDAAEQIDVIPVHPHVRGVYGLVASSINGRAGPSPRAWGLLPAIITRSWESWSIPTCVGFTSKNCHKSVTEPVHPHVRGVYYSFGILIECAVRSIPTCVGFTVSFG